MKKVIRITAFLLLIAMLAVPASAAGFTPSVEQKGAPTVTAEGRSVYVVPLSEREQVSEKIQKTLEDAYNSIVSAGSLEKAAPALTDALATVAPSSKVENLVVRDLMYVQTGVKAGEKVTVKFDLKVEKNAVVIPMMLVDGQWVPVDPALVTINVDGTVSVVFTGDIGIIAFVTEMSK